MYPDSPFARPIGSFQRPVPLVVVDPDDAPDWSVCFRKEWLPYVIGSLQQLLLQSTWKTDDPDEINTAQGRAQLLVSLFVNGCPVTVPETGCLAYPMNAPFISYYPQNPYTDPDGIPPWYGTQPFRIAAGDIITEFLGLAEGDIVVLPTAFPSPDAVAEHGLSAIGLDITGEGVVELHFVTVIAGGMALVTVDGDLLGTRPVDLNADVLSVPPELPGEMVEEITLVGAGAHHIDIRFSPVIDDSALPIRYGGAIRSVVLCDFDDPPEGTLDTTLDVRQSTELPCVLEKQALPDGDWVQFANLQLCAPRIRMSRGIMEFYDGSTWQTLEDGGDERQDGESDPQWETPPEGESGNCLAAENITAVFATTMEQTRAGLIAGQAALVVTVTVTGIMSVFMPAAIISVFANSIALALVSGGITFLDSIVDTDNANALKCAIFCYANGDGSVTASQFNKIRSDLDTSISDSAVRGIYQLWLDGLGPVGLTRAAAAGGITSGDCGDCECLELEICVFSGQGTPDDLTPDWDTDVTVVAGYAFGQYATTFAFNQFVNLRVISYDGWTQGPNGNISWQTRPSGSVGCVDTTGLLSYNHPDENWQIFDGRTSLFAVTSPTPFTLVFHIS